MKNIEREMLQAIKNKQNWNKSNTSVEYINVHNKEYAIVMLFGNHIGNYHYNTNKFRTNIETLLDWPSVTTFSRLRALGVNVTQKNWRVYIDGQLIGNKLSYDYTDGLYKNRELLK